MIVADVVKADPLADVVDLVRVDVEADVFQASCTDWRLMPGDRVLVKEGPDGLFVSGWLGWLDPDSGAPTNGM